MNIWSVREKSLHWLEDELNPESQLLQNGFDYLYSIIELFEKIGQDEGKSEQDNFAESFVSLWQNIAAFCWAVIVLC